MAGKGLGTVAVEGLVNFFINKRRSSRAEELIEQLEEDLRQTTQEAIPASLPSKPGIRGTAQTPTAIAAEPSDPLEAALAGIRESEGEVKTGPTGLPIPTPIVSAAPEPGDLVAGIEEAKERTNRKRALTRTLKTGLSVRRALLEIDKIFPPGSQENANWRQSVLNSADAAANRLNASATAERFNALGGDVTAEQLVAIGPAGVRQMNKNLRELAPGEKTEVVSVRGLTADGREGFRKRLIRSRDGRDLGPVGTDEFRAPPVARTQDVNLTQKAKASAAADKELTFASNFVEGAFEVMQMLTPETVQGSAVTVVRAAAGWLRTASALIRNELATDVDFDAIPEEFFKGINTLSGPVMAMLTKDANLRSSYAHLAQLYFRSTNPSAKSMTASQLKEATKALGSALNDPKQMRAVIRNITRIIVRKAFKNSKGRGLREAGYDQYAPDDGVNILGNLDPRSRYAVPEAMAFALKFDEDQPEPGATLEELRTAPDTGPLVEVWYDVVTGTRLLPNQVRDILDKHGYPNVGLDDLNEAYQNPHLGKQLQELLGITTSAPEVIEPTPDLSNTILLSPTTIKALEDEFRRKFGSDLPPRIE